VSGLAFRGNARKGYGLTAALAWRASVDSAQGTRSVRPAIPAGWPENDGSVPAALPSSWRGPGARFVAPIAAFPSPPDGEQQALQVLKPIRANQTISAVVPV